VLGSVVLLYIYTFVQSLFTLGQCTQLHCTNVHSQWGLVPQDNKVNNIMMVETETEPEENEMGEERLLLQAINEHIPEGLQLQEVLVAYRLRT
jgi:hypothetical protein